MAVEITAHTFAPYTDKHKDTYARKVDARTKNCHALLLRLGRRTLVLL